MILVLRELDSMRLHAPARNYSIKNLNKTTVQCACAAIDRSINNLCFENSGCSELYMAKMATKESTSSPDKKPPPGLTIVDESEILLDWGPDQDIEQLLGVEDSDEEKDEKETIQLVSFQRAKTPEASAQESTLTKPGHHSESSKPAEKTLTSAGFVQSTSLSPKDTKRKQGHKFFLNLPTFLKRGEKEQPVESISSTRKSKSPSPSPKSSKSPQPRYLSPINLATITEQDGLPYEVASCIK